MIPRSKKVKIKWKGFEFPVSITEFSMREDAKLATYEYAGRDGAEHERVLAPRGFTITGIFSQDDNNDSPITYVKKLRELNNNEPGELFHPDIGSFDCIVKNLSFTQSGDDYEPDEDGGGTSAYRFTMELVENTDPTKLATEGEASKLFSAFDSKPVSDDYSTSQKYSSPNQLFAAILTGKIGPGTDPIRNAEWLSYDYDFRVQAYQRWEEYLASRGESEQKEIEETGAKQYTVLPGETGLQIAVKNNVSFPALYALNKGRLVRLVSQPDEGLYWKTSSKLFAGDSLLIPKAGTIQATASSTQKTEAKSAVESKAVSFLKGVISDAYSKASDDLALYEKLDGVPCNEGFIQVNSKLLETAKDALSSTPSISATKSYCLRMTADKK